MNIFVVHENPRIAARMLCNEHVVKMTLESTQMLATVLIRHGVTDDVLRRFGVLTKTGRPYRATHLSHPCVMWANESRQAFDWLATHALALATEYGLRFGKNHACTVPILGCVLIAQTQTLPQPFVFGPMKPFPQAMPDEHKVPNDAVRAYRSYYHEKCANWAEAGRPPKWPLKALDPNRGGIDTNPKTARGFVCAEGLWTHVPTWLKAGQVSNRNRGFVEVRVGRFCAEQVREDRESRCLITGNSLPTRLSELFG